jgi:DNA-binding NtrC family response regulator
MSWTRVERGSGLSQLVALPAVEQLRILLVEDERFVREVAVEVLVSAGYKVLNARNVSEAMKVFLDNREPLELLITDVMLPGKNGYWLSRELSTICPTMKTILMSGYPERSPAGGEKQSNVFYLAKPFSVDSLMMKVQQALSQELPAAENPS